MVTVGHRGWPLLATASALLAGALALADVHSPLRVLVVLWFVLACPGGSIVRFLRLGDPVAELTLAVGVSLALATIVAVTDLYLGLWSPDATLLVLIAVTLVASAAAWRPWRWAEGR
jgi:hypothetical protein